MNYLVINFVSTLDYLINTMCVYLFLKKSSPVLLYYLQCIFFHQKIQAKDRCDINEISRTNLALCSYFILCLYVYFFSRFFLPSEIIPYFTIIRQPRALFTPPLHCLIADWLPKTVFHKSLLEKYDFWQSKWLICVKNTLVN